MKKILLTLFMLPLLYQISVAQTQRTRETELISGFSSAQDYTIIEITGEILKGMSDRLGSIASQLDRISIATTENSSNIVSMKSQVADLLSSSSLNYNILVSVTENDREVKVATRKIGNTNNNCYLIFSSEPTQSVLVIITGDVDINSLTGFATQFGVEIK